MAIPVVDVSGNERAVKLIRAIHVTWDAVDAVRAAVTAVDFSGPVRAVHDEMLWQLVNTVDHSDVTGQSVEYKAGRLAVNVRVFQHVRASRHVERDVRGSTLVTYEE
jgi:hypothetical protein